MPKYLTSSKARRKGTGCPSSPFQKLIEGARITHGLTIRELHRAVDAIAPCPLSTFWLWLHTTNGAPAPRTFKPAHVKALARALRLSEQDIKEAYDASRHHFTEKENPAPRDASDALRILRDMLRNDRRKYIPTMSLLNIVTRLAEGAENKHASST